ncbi:MAG: tRNA pseudouridine(13) synthase TruD [Planctomycetes bacterium]|nr:tRNA pseudouridine(13) synthase TruD [Planctomycetota bacterium]
MGLPHLTQGTPGIGGVIKRYNEDFLVEEIPLYRPSGAGTHTYFVVEKQGMTTLAAVQMIARALGRRPQDIGYAGLKDAHGITRQMFSIEHVEPERVAALSFKRVGLEVAGRHGNKLKLGHLAGNRFVIRVRDLPGRPEEALPRARDILAELSRRGVPNYFGPQRFGARGDNADIGRAILREDFAEAVALVLGRPGPFDHGDVQRARGFFDAGDLQGAAAAWPWAFHEQRRLCQALVRTGDPRRAWRVVNHTLRKLYFSAFQGELFNRVLARRLGGVDRLWEGDMAWIHRNGACFRVEDAAREQPRCEALEISPTGPLFGRRMTAAEGAAGEMEAAVLAEEGLSSDQFVSTDGTRFEGGRRPLRVPLGEATVEAAHDERGPHLVLSFDLPPGGYATSVTREVCKVGVASG